MTSFALQLQQFRDKVGDRADDAVGLIVVRAAAEIDSRSPVGDAKYWQSPPPKGYVGGRFRGNWQLGVNVRPGGELSRIDPTGSATQGEIVAAIPESAAGNVYYITNNLPYANRLEEGYSRQAPAGIVGLTVIGLQADVAEIVAGLQ